MVDYKLLNKQLQELIEGEDNLVGILANATALLKETTGWFWIGFYLVSGENLILGPFQGPMACFKIGFGKGVCGTAWKNKSSIVVPDVDQFPGHIACSSLSRSEIVVPLWKKTEVAGVLDIDSVRPDEFSEYDRLGLEEFCSILSSKL